MSLTREQADDSRDNGKEPDIKMTKREVFAALALAGILASDTTSTSSALLGAAVEFADRLLLQLEAVDGQEA